MSEKELLDKLISIREEKCEPIENLWKIDALIKEYSEVSVLRTCDECNLKTNKPCYVDRIWNNGICSAFKSKEECYHQWRYYNKWCQECSEFGHGVIVSHCYKCDKLWDKEFGFWSKEEIDNIFFNEHFQTDLDDGLTETISHLIVAKQKESVSRTCFQKDTICSQYKDGMCTLLKTHPKGFFCQFLIEPKESVSLCFDCQGYAEIICEDGTKVCSKGRAVGVRCNVYMPKESVSRKCYYDTELPCTKEIRDKHCFECEHEPKEEYKPKNMNYLNLYIDEEEDDD